MASGDSTAARLASRSSAARVPIRPCSATAAHAVAPRWRRIRLAAVLLATIASTAPSSQRASAKPRRWPSSMMPLPSGLVRISASPGHNAAAWPGGGVTMATALHGRASLACSRTSACAAPMRPKLNGSFSGADKWIVCWISAVPTGGVAPVDGITPIGGTAPAGGATPVGGTASVRTITPGGDTAPIRGAGSPYTCWTVGPGSTARSSSFSSP